MRSLLAFALFLLVIQPVTAICPFPAPKPCDLFARSTAVFVGEVVASEEKRAENQGPETVYTLHVTERLKGDLSGSVRVTTENNSGGEFLDRGRPYLIFASAVEPAHKLRIRCGDTFSGAALKPALAATRRLRALGPAVKGSIMVLVSAKEQGESPLQHAKVIIHGGRGRVTGHTDARGIFTARLPAGEYRVFVRDTEPTAYANGYSPEHIQLFPGECVAIALIAKRSGLSH